jgi:hypothetical protein
MLNGQIISDKELSGKLVKNEELFNHEYLYNRNAYDAHPIHAITGLKEKLAELENKAPNDFKLIKAEISRLLTNISEERTRAQASEKQIQADIDKLTKVLATIQNNEETEKLVIALAKLRVENLELKNELIEAVNKVSEDLVEQISLLQDLSATTNTSITNLTEADITLKKDFSEKFINIETTISAHTDAIVEIEKKVATQEAVLVEVKDKLDALNNDPEVPSNGIIDALLETFVTTTDIITVEQNISELKSRVDDIESSINGVLSRLDILDTQVETIPTLSEDIQSLSKNVTDPTTGILSRVITNEATIATNNEKLQSLQTATDKNTADIAATESEIELLKTSVETLEETLNKNNIAGVDLTVIEIKISNLEDDVTQLRSDLINKIQDETNLLKGSIDSISSYINKFQTEDLPEIQENIHGLKLEVAETKGVAEDTKQIVKTLSKTINRLEEDFSNRLQNLDTEVSQFNTTKETVNRLDTDVALLQQDTTGLNTLISQVNYTNDQQNTKLDELDKSLRDLNVAVFGSNGEGSLDSYIQDLQNQINNMSSVFHFVGIIDTTTTKTAKNGKPEYLISKPNLGNAKVTLRDSIYTINKPYEAQPGDVVLVELFNEFSKEQESLGYAEFVFIKTPAVNGQPARQDWEELGNIQILDAQLQHHIQTALASNEEYKNTINGIIDGLETELNHHIAKDFETRSLIFSSREAAELYARGMDPDRFPTPEGTPPPGDVGVQTNAYPGLIITVATDGLYESYIIKEDRSLTLISGGGGSGGSPDIGTDYQYCFRANTELDTSFAAVDNNGFVNGYVAVSIEKPTRKNNVLQIDASLTDGGDYIYYLSTISNLKFTCNGFYAPFINLGQLTQALNGINYTLYRSSRKITEAIELVIN